VAELPALTETLVGLSEQLSPLDGVIDSVRLTVPAKPLRLATVIMEVPVVSTFIVTVVGFSEIEKSWTMMVTATQ